MFNYLPPQETYTMSEGISTDAFECLGSEDKGIYVWVNIDFCENI